ncbi:2-aminoethanethiol dioxygenase [Lepeophtheirus salmonis]|uniref:2-aminoethanethiol dioxygenase n=1 Tax=Lepeophtheirus salmonis TaxID=72036 RepID=D3PJV0_LEPSM|nr:2-aminoethanethiol dioxygenase-like [Lepeophtheirus salmonis]ADD38836.1 2-aminoethanethiol dioxygenase [Lepeophtheirus salmonis]
MSARLQRIIKMAKSTFSSRKGQITKLDDQLIKALNAVTLEDILTDPQAVFHLIKGLPLYYVDLYEDKNVSIGVFLLNKSGKIPLHDHPRMTGVIKCIEGSIKVSSYTSVEQAKEDGITLATPHGDVIMSVSTDPKMLTPTSQNIHEVHNASASSPAAFLDLLSPPYNMPNTPVFSPRDEVRNCNYYEVVKSGDQASSEGVVKLKMVEKPEQFIAESLQNS